MVNRLVLHLGGEFVSHVLYLRRHVIPIPLIHVDETIRAIVKGFRVPPMYW